MRYLVGGRRKWAKSYTTARIICDRPLIRRVGVSPIRAARVGGRRIMAGFAKSAIGRVSDPRGDMGLGIGRPTELPQGPSRPPTTQCVGFPAASQRRASLSANPGRLSGQDLGPATRSTAVISRICKSPYAIDRRPDGSDFVTAQASFSAIPGRLCEIGDKSRHRATGGEG